MVDLGKGLHSEAGRAKIRPALENLCDEYVKILNSLILYAHRDRSQAWVHTLPGSQECWSAYCAVLTQGISNIVFMHKFGCY